MSSSSHGGTSRDGGEKGWSPQPVFAYLVRGVLIVAPFVAGWLSIRFTQQFFLRTDGRWADISLWLAQAVLISFVVSNLTARYLHRLTPLVALFHMSLVFPDHAPSRFSLALRAGSVKKLMAEPSLKLSNDVQLAAEEALLLVTQLAKHEPLTRGHTERVRAYAEMIGREMGMPAEDLNKLRWGALLHDIGKLTVPAEILSKPSAPTAEEWEVLRRHPSASVPLLAPLEGWLGEWLKAASEHHERWDGSGYPSGLAKTEISLAGRITAVADAFDVITSRRSYKAPSNADEARQELVASAGSHFDPVVVRAFLEAGLNRASAAGRFGWLLEAPGFARLFNATTQAAGAAAVAVAATAVGVVGSPSSPVPVPDEIAFVETSTTTPMPIEFDEMSPTTTEPASEGVSTTVRDRTTTTVTLATSGDVGSSTSTGASTTLPVSSTTASVSSTAPSTTSLTSTTSTTSTTTTTTPPTPCEQAQAGVQVLIGADLRGCDLAAFVGPGVDFSFADLSGADLGGAVITDFNLEGANLGGADLRNTTFRNGNLKNAKFTSGVDASGITLDAVDVAGADLRGANLAGATLRSMSFGFADARDANLSGIDPDGVNFNDANLGGALMTNATFTGTEFFRTTLDGTNFGGSSFTLAVFGDSTGTPIGTTTASFTDVTCPDWSFISASCW